MVDAGDHIRAVGWLSADHPYDQGEIPSETLVRIREFANLWGESTDALGWGVLMGTHTCEFCRRARRTGNFGVPQADLLYVAPELLPHYVEQHGYRPPAEFLAAVMLSPLPGTPEYRTAAEPFARLREQLRQHPQVILSDLT
jgi:hypothetical protein